MTETMGGVVYDGLALQGVEVRIVTTDPACGIAPPRRARESSATIELRSPTLLRTYRDGTDPVRRDGWYRTGDLGRIDPVTRLLGVHGRADDLIITGGEKVWPDPVEAVLRADLAGPRRRGRRAARPGVGPARRGRRGPRATPTTHRRSRGCATWCAHSCPRAAAPKELELVDSLPRTGLGKIRRSLLVTRGSEHPPHG